MIACTEPLYERARAVVDGLACRQRLLLELVTVLMPTVVHPVTVMAGYDIVLHPKIYIYIHSCLGSLAHPRIPRDYDTPKTDECEQLTLVNSVIALLSSPPPPFTLG